MFWKEEEEEVVVREEVEDDGNCDGEDDGVGRRGLARGW